MKEMGKDGGGYMADVRLTELVRSSGCNAKLPPGDLHDVLGSLPLASDPRLFGGYEKSDDACVYDLGDGRVLIETVDFFPPMVDDPFTFGEIAAANALSDIYAMGGSPDVALSLMCFPSCLDLSVMRSIMLGAMEKAKEAGCVIAGGHTISDREPKFGLSVTAIEDKDSVWTNSGAREGDCLVLTKRLGVGVMMTAHKGGETEATDAIESMRILNKRARDIARGLTVHAATDVTGFSLLGHAYEMADGSDATAYISLPSLSFFPEAPEFARFGFLPEGRYTNEDYLGDKVMFAPQVEKVYKDLLFSPETSGGLLLAMPEKDASQFIDEFGEPARVIGHIERKSGSRVIVSC